MTENPSGRQSLVHLEPVRGPTRSGRTPGAILGRTAATARSASAAALRAAVLATLARAPSSCSLLRASSRFLRNRLFCVFVRHGRAPGVPTLAAGGWRGRFRTRGGQVGASRDRGSRFRGVGLLQREEEGLRTRIVLAGRDTAGQASGELGTARLGPARQGLALRYFSRGMTSGLCEIS